MELTKTYVNQVKKYIESTGIYKQKGLFEAKDPHDDSVTVFATNSISLIWFTPFGDDEQIRGSDFTGLEVNDGSAIVGGGVWEHVVKPYVYDFNWNYREDPIAVPLSDLREQIEFIKEENDIPKKIKLYDVSIQTSKVDARIGGFYIVPELLYDVGKLVGKDTIEVYIPKKNPYHPVVVVGENKYGRHLGFVLGTGKNAINFANK